MPPLAFLKRRIEKQDDSQRQGHDEIGGKEYRVSKGGEDAPGLERTPFEHVKTQVLCDPVPGSNGSAGNECNNEEIHPLFRGHKIGRDVKDHEVTYRSA